MTVAPKIVILDYGSGNVNSAAHALERAGASVSLSDDPAKVAAADGLVVPGVGAFAAVMEALRAKRAGAMIERRLAGGRAVLGICVGLQVMFESGDENGVVTTGLGQWPGTVTSLPALRLPHMGWSRVHADSGSRLLEGLDGKRFYFVHSYACLTDPALALGYGSEVANQVPAASHSPHLENSAESSVSLSGIASNKHFRAPLVSWAHYGADFVAAVENGPLTATQFHPEKSGEAGARLFANWLATL